MAGVAGRASGSTDVPATTSPLNLTYTALCLLPPASPPSPFQPWTRIASPFNLTCTALCLLLPLLSRPPVPLSALDPHYKSIQSLDAKMEAVRTALTASTRHLLNELSSDAAASAVRGGAAAASASTSELEVAARAAAVAAEAAAHGAAGSHAEAMKVCNCVRERGGRGGHTTSQYTT